MPQPESFFAKQLPGEPPLPFSLASELVTSAATLARKTPWDLLIEEQLIFVDDPQSPDPHVCTIIGGNGESFGLIAFIGPAAFSNIYNLQNSQEETNGTFLRHNYSISAEFAPRNELQPPDLNLLRSVGFKPDRGRKHPQFRTTRPRYLPWYITAAEGRIIKLCLDAALHLIADRTPDELDSLWPAERAYPLVSAAHDFTITAITREIPPEEMPPPAVIDRDRLKKIVDRGFRSKGETEIDFLYLPVPIGERDERKKAMRLALAADAEIGTIYPPEAVDIDIADGDAMVDCLLTSIESAKVIPNVIHVRGRANKAILAPVAASLGAELKVHRKLPALDAATAAMLEHLAG